MANLTERQLERAFCALEKRRDATSKQAANDGFCPSTRMALAKAADAMSAALLAIQTEPSRKAATRVVER